MSLTAAEVAEIMRLVEQSSFDELVLEMNGVKLCLRRGAAAGAPARVAVVSDAVPAGAPARAAEGAAQSSYASATFGAPGTAGATPSATNRAPSAAHSSGTTSSGNGAAAIQPRATTPPDPNLHDVPSPLLGTFYRSPKPGAAPYIDIGAKVDEDTVIAIIEVMKLMNTVRAGVKGTITDIFPADGSLVEYEQPIVRIRKTG